MTMRRMKTLAINCVESARRAWRPIIVAITAVSALLAAFWLSLALSPDATAHEQRVAVTEILFNSNTGNIEVAHRINLHDAEHAVQDQWGIADLLSDPEDLKKLAIYTRSNFFLWNGEKQLKLSPVGVEVDDIYVWVYDEAPIPKKRVRNLSVENYILRDVWPDQANLVNLEIGKFRKSMFFSKNDEKKRIEIKTPN